MDLPTKIGPFWSGSGAAQCPLLAGEIGPKDIYAKLSITHQYLKRHHISDKMICPYEDNITCIGI